MEASDRDGREPLDLLDEIERVLKIQCAPVTWPVGMGRAFRGVYHLHQDAYHLYQNKQGSQLSGVDVIEGLTSDAARAKLGDQVDELAEEIELIRGATADFDRDKYLAGAQTPVFFGAAIHNFGVEQLLDAFVQHAPGPQPRSTTTRVVDPDEKALTGFVFKIQANMDPAHRDRIAFMRVCSGRYQPGMRLYQPRLGREQIIRAEVASAFFDAVADAEQPRLLVVQEAVFHARETFGLARQPFQRRDTCECTLGAEPDVCVPRCQLRILRACISFYR